MRLKFGFLSALLAGALVVGASAPAKAITLTVSVTDSSGIVYGGSVAGDRQAAESVSALDNGGSAADSIGNSIDFVTRYISTAAADRASNSGGGTQTATINSNYTVTFTVSGAYSGEQWTATIGTTLRGGLTALDDATGGIGGGGTASVTNVTGKLNGTTDSLLSLASSASQGGTSSTSGTQVNVNASNSKIVTGTGNGSFTLNFTWTSLASSPQNLLGGDETGARFGYNNPLGGASADDYPGPSGASRPNGLSTNPALGDGHWVTGSLVVNTVPEPSTLALAGIGALGCGLAAWRRRRS